MILKRGLTIIRPTQAAEVQAAAKREGVPLYAISASDRETFFDAVRSFLPLNPPLRSSRSWDALADSLWQGLYDLKVPRTVILWIDTALFREESPEDFDTALAVLTGITEELADQGPTAGRPMEVCVYVDEL